MITYIIIYYVTLTYCKVIQFEYMIKQNIHLYFTLLLFSISIIPSLGIVINYISHYTYERIDSRIILDILIILIMPMFYTH